jgi:hypothetical protein
MATTITDRRRLFLRADGIFAVPAGGEGSEGGGTGGTPDPHAPTHAAGGSDPVTLTQAQITGLAAALAGKASTTHATTHQPGGADAMAVDAAPTTGSLRTLGTGANQAAPGNDARFTAPSTPTAHHTTHEPGGADALANVAWTNVANTFTQDQAVSKALPAVVMHDTNEATDARRFRIRNFGGELAFAALSDANAIQKTPLTLNRAGDAVVGTNLTVGGNASVFGSGGNVAVKDQANTFTGNQAISTNAPSLSFQEADQPVDQRRFRLIANAQQFFVQAVNDAESAVVGTPLVLTRSGLVMLGAGQLQFPATANPSADPTTLDDYREVAWTPTLTAVGGQSGQVYVYRRGYSMKVGGLVVCWGRLSISTKGTFGSGGLAITGLPAPIGLAEFTSFGTITYFSGVAVAVSNIGLICAPGATQADLYYLPGSGATAHQVFTAAQVVAGFDIIFSITYQT